MQTAANTKTIINLEQIKGDVAAKMDSASFTSWIAPLDFNVVDGVLVLTAQNQFSADYIGSVHFGTLSMVAEQYNLGLKIAVRGAKVAAQESIANDNNVQTYAPVAEVEPKKEIVSNAFDSFVACEENSFVLSACKKIASGAVAFSPLFIYGPAGCGKSLLLNCINLASNGRTIMMTGSQFVAEFARSLQNRSVFAFKDFCRNCDTFILDDVQTLAGKRASCEEFLQLVMDLRMAGKNVVLTSNVAPNNLSGFDRRAQSLLASGLVADVVAPTADVKRVMLMRAGVNADVAAGLAKRIAGDGHLIGGVANKIKAYNELMGTSVDMNVAERLLADSLQKSKTPMAMVKSMCEKLGVSYDAVCGKGRSRALVLARQIMMVVLKEATDMSLAEIGCVCGDRDHATVLYAIKQVEQLKKTDLVLASQIQELVAECK